MIEILLSAALWVGVGPDPVTHVRPMAEIIEIRPAMVSSDEHRGDQIRYGGDPEARVVAQAGADGVVWDGAAEARERYGAGADAPELIYVKAYDAIFAIDPFVELPQAQHLIEWKSDVGIAAMRQLFFGTSLETDRTLFDRRMIERTEELFWELERVRNEWLIDNGYTEELTVDGEGAEVITPEQQRGRDIRDLLLTQGEPSRVSLPFTMQANFADKVRVGNPDAGSDI